MHGPWSFHVVVVCRKTAPCKRRRQPTIMPPTTHAHPLLPGRKGVHQFHLLPLVVLPPASQCLLWSDPDPAQARCSTLNRHPHSRTNHTVAARTVPLCSLLSTQRI
jgi:hypothetical protein